MKVIFAGTPELAVPCLQALIDSEHEICAAYTQPDRPAGRGRKLQQSPVKTLALANNIAVEQPDNFKSEQDVQTLQAYNADIMVVIAYGLLLPDTVLNSFKFGCINPHVSLLPKWRGAAPIQRAIEAGDRTTGVTLIQMDAGWDTGPMLAKTELDIHDNDTSQSIHDKLAIRSAELLIAALPKIADGSIEPIKQDDAASSHAKKLSKAEAKIDWHNTAKQIDQKIRAFNPWPVCYCNFNDKIMRVWQAKVIDNNNKNDSPGKIIAASKEGIDIACEQGVLRLLEIQLPGNKRISTRDFFNAMGQQLIDVVLN